MQIDKPNNISVHTWNGIRECPFCGSEAILKGRHLFYVICTGANCRGAYEPSVQVSNAADAIDMWNRRTTTPIAQAGGVAIPDDVYDTISGALAQRKFDIYQECGCSTDELKKLERLIAKYDKAFHWLFAQRRTQAQGEVW